MAWKPANRVESGELDNRVRGCITGWIRLFGRMEPLVLNLEGDCLADLAGWRFRIVRLSPIPDWAEHVDLQGLSADQSGDAGEITAAQRLRHFDLPIDEIMARMRAGQSPPNDWRSALYIEWYSVRNGRVVIQDTRLGVERIGRRGFTLTSDDLRCRAEDAQREIDELRQLGLIRELGEDHHGQDETADGSDLQAILDCTSNDIERAIQRSLKDFEVTYENQHE